MKSTMVYS
uniref:Uncharacterized protein n=1 Tax=Rhizophora mucronata TaxID=61149 RepID=A0A2P2MZ65_RHIMU